VLPDRLNRGHLHPKQSVYTSPGYSDLVGGSTVVKAVNPSQWPKFTVAVALSALTTLDCECRYLETQWMETQSIDTQWIETV